MSPSISPSEAMQQFNRELTELRRKRRAVISRMYKTINDHLTSHARTRISDHYETTSRNSTSHRSDS